MGVTVTETKTKAKILTITKTMIGTKTHPENLFLQIIFTDMRKPMAIGFDDYVDGDEDAGKGNDKDKVVLIKS